MKNTLIVGLTSAALGAALGVIITNQLSKSVISSPVSITTFKIKVPFNQWSKGFDSKGAMEMHKSNNITPIYRGVSINDPSKVVVIHQSEPGVVKKLLSENKKMIEETERMCVSTVKIKKKTFFILCYIM